MYKYNLFSGAWISKVNMYKYNLFDLQFMLVADGAFAENYF
jgi:hypothetical protein